MNSLISELLTSQKVETPAYFYDEGIINRQIEKLLLNKPTNFNIYYAMKGNSNPFIVEYLKNKGFGVEIASSGELFIAQRVGYKGEHILFTGPSKSDEELEESVQYSIKTVHIESIDEAIRLDKICKRLGKVQDVLVRVNANFEVHTYSTQLSGCPSPFGISEESIFEKLPKILSLKNIRFQGIHVYNASGILDYKILLQNVDNVFHLVQKIEEKFSQTICSIIDFGGGFGVDYSKKDDFDGVSVQSFYSGVQEKIEKFGFKERELIMEISRFFVAESGYYAVSIQDIKDSRGIRYYITNGGVHHYMTGRHFERNHPISTIRKYKKNMSEKVNITGKLCTGIDYLAQDINIEVCERGDILIIEKTGAYGINAGISHFLSHQMPPEILISNNSWKIIRERGSHNDLFLNIQYNSV